MSATMTYECIWGCGARGSVQGYICPACFHQESLEAHCADDAADATHVPAPALPPSTFERTFETPAAPAQALPTDSAARKGVPLARGLLDYFPAALAEVAHLSKVGNDKHNPGQEMHHARGKSSDHADCIMRHLADRGIVDPEDGIRHSVKVAWRALALLQEELEAAGAPLARGARLPEVKP